MAPGDRDGNAHAREFLLLNGRFRWEGAFRESRSFSLQRRALRSSATQEGHSSIQELCQRREAGQCAPCSLHFHLSEPTERGRDSGCKEHQAHHLCRKIGSWRWRRRPTKARASPWQGMLPGCFFPQTPTACALHDVLLNEPGSRCENQMCCNTHGESTFSRDNEHRWTNTILHASDDSPRKVTQLS